MTHGVIQEPLLVLVGPTAIGKTDLSLTLSHQHNCEIVSVDSMQVYKYMDIGTAKVSVQERAEIPHHLIDIVLPNQDYDAAKFAEDSLQAIREIHSRNKIPLLTGGTGMYLRALLEGIFHGVPVNREIRNKLNQRLEEEGCSKLHEELAACDSISAKRIHQKDTQRLLRALEIFYSSGTPWSEHLDQHKNSKDKPKFANVLQLGLTCDRAILYERINQRCNAMLDAGLEKEVRELLSMGFQENLKCFSAIGYRHMLNHINGEWTTEELNHFLARDTRRYAKRQYTWFSKMEELIWFDVAERKNILQKVEEWLAGKAQKP